jgi:hypothetical protein
MSDGKEHKVVVDWLTPGAEEGISCENLMLCSPSPRGQVRPVSSPQTSKESFMTVIGIPNT